ncbi:MAG TPA: proprotein convertase P-domain-containing protein [Pyrinomonadaceae bacterium]|nr:proprotein convertase P-domain-containing protein [Pyrinomonadaceae bacterium]
MKKYIVALIVGFALVASLVVLPTGYAQRNRRIRVSPNEEKSPAKNAKTKTPNTRSQQQKSLPAPRMLRAARAQEEAAPAPVSAQAVAFAVTAPLAELEPDKGPGTDVVDPDKVSVHDNDQLRTPVAGAPITPDAMIQTDAPSGPTALSPAPSTSFDGISNADNANPAFGGLGRVLPPDTNGDVGPTHYVQTVNTLVRIYLKNGTPAGNPFLMSTLFTALPAGNACRTSDDGDPIVLYDELADRWMISQFATIANPNNHQCIAVSKTGDPTGQYFVYDFQMPNNKFNDYPHFGIYPDAYYMTDNQFNQAGTAFQGGGVFAFNRRKMLVGDPTANFIYFDLATNDGGMLPADADGLVPPPPGAPGYFAQFTATEFGDASDALRIFQFHADYATPANSTFTQLGVIPVAAFDPRAPNSRNVIEQPSPGVALDVIADRLMNRLQYRNFGTHESLVVAHSVNVGLTPTTAAGHQGAVRYYELRRSLPSGAFTVPEQATFAPDTHNRFMPSAAMDNQGNLAVGYSVSSTTVRPSVRYAGRLAGDPANSLAQGETTLVAGTGVQTHTSGRWGDYSSMNLDPTDDCTFWFTTEYYTAASQASSAAGWLTRIGSFKFPTCTAPAQGTLTGIIKNCNTGLPVAGALVQVSDGHSRVTDANGNYSVNLPPGTYTVTASGAGLGSPAPVSVTINNGGAATADLCLAGIPVLQTAGSVVTAESCSPTDSALSPGETVTMGFALKNTGTGDTANLVATLLPTGGITSPSGPQTYGALVAGGPAASQPYTFTVDPSAACGGTVVATFQLQDGPTNLGTVSYPLTVGALGAVVTNTYTSGNIATAIPDVATVDIPITVPNTGAINDVNVRVRLNHTFDGDLVLKLVHPDGTAVTLSNRRGSTGQNYGTGANDCSATAFTVFDDSAAANISGGIAPFANSFKPESPLAAFNGKATNGVWKLRISDEAALDTGTVGCVQLELTRQKFTCCGAGGPPLLEAAPPAVLVSESASPANGAPDPEETVTMNFPIRNIGDGPTTNLVATLLPTGGVNAPQTDAPGTYTPSGPQTYGAVQPTGVAVSKPFTFVARGNCGDLITATLQLQDGAANLGTLTYSIRLGSTVTNTASFGNTAQINVPANQPTTSTGAAGPYPSTINVSGVSGTVSKVTVQLFGMHHTFPDDLDLLLVGPQGQKMMLMSDAGGTGDLVATNLTFDDTAAASLPDSATILAGTFKPTNFGTGDTFPTTGIPGPPPPVGPYPDPQLLSVFNGTNPNGTWRLYVTDDVGGDFGRIAGGWRLSFTTAAPACVNQACTLNVPASIVQGSDPGQFGAIVNYPAPTTSGNCGVLTTSHASGSFFPVGTTNVTATCTRGDNTTTDGTFTVTVNDTETPVISCPGNITVGNDANACSAVVNVGTPSASDNDPQFTTGGTRSDSQPLNAPYPIGTTTITWTATDRAGNSASCQQTVTVNDTQSPSVGAATATPSSMWPPNHQMVNVTVNYTTGDNCPGSNCVLSVTSNEPVNGLGDGDTAPDWVIIDDHHVQLRAERSGKGSGRIYTIKVTCTDAAGNATVKTTTVNVPHSK